jgi:hypothetical protein
LAAIAYPNWRASASIGVALEVTDLSIIGNHFNPTTGTAQGTGIEITLVTGNGGVILGNVFDTQTYGIVLGAGSTPVNVQNSYHNNTTNISNAGTSNTLGGGSQ